ncbi:hypothetical protein ACJRO7_026633 [Eucalyptus globulus]|uniref:AAA+ ATPase domain-containing protein n=1 Tax=Eucalyptus globulus TaxID=34317 RepID=A0ABD3JSH2_EUCGL
MEDSALCRASKAVKCVVAPAVKCLVARVRRHCGYVIFSDRRVCKLNVEVKELGDKKDEVQRSIDDARNIMKPIKAMGETWVKEVETVADKARDVLDYDGRAQKTCFYGWLPNPKVRYLLGKKASRMVQNIQKLMGQVEEVDSENPPPGLVGGALYVNSLAGDEGDFITDSRASIFLGIMKALNDEKVKVVGVYGPGGVGKTTLLKIVEEKLNKEGTPFHMIVKSKVSQTPDLTKIQFDIAYALGLKDLKDEPSEEGRRDLLFKRLQTDPSEKVLIILDDLWAELDLKAIGIPLGNESMKCKLLLASRDKRVLEQRMHADQTFHLKSLEEDEAFKLFEKIVSDRLRDDEELKEKAAQVVTKLAGLPLLINSVASTLKYSDVSTWEDMLIKIEDPHNERIVKWSYDHLESEEAKCLFLLCGLIGGTIEVELLLGLGMGLGLFGKFDNNMQSSRNRLNTMLNRLHSFCLLHDGGDGKENVTIHDLYSEVVVSDVFSGRNSLMINNNYGSWPKEKLEKCWACLVNVGSGRLAELILRRFPHVKILMLSEQYDRGDCSKMDFTYMEELRALYLCSMRITSLPSSMEILRNLQSLSINCYVEDVANLGKLKALQILSFTKTRISRLPKEIGELTNLRSLNLNHCYSLKIIEPGALKALINLEELHMRGSFDRWMGKHEMTSKSCGVGLAELKSLTKLASLEISIRQPIILLEDNDLPFENLVRFWINIGNLEGWGYERLAVMKLNLEGCNSILSRNWVQKSLQKTQYLYLCELSESKESAHKLCTKGFQDLKALNVKDSCSIKYIANSPYGLPPFLNLESLFLENLINLEKICHGPIALGCFSNLKTMSIGQCHQLKYLWCISDMQRLVQLEEIKVWECYSMQSIVTHDVGEDIVSADNRVELPNVCRLALCESPNMTSFCIRAEITSEDTPPPIQVLLPRLKSLVMDGLLGLENILYSEPSLKYSDLTSLKIRQSKSTSKSIMKSNWILKLPNLEDAEILSRLTELSLSWLSNLRCMWKQDVQLQGISIFQSLKKLSINNTRLSFLFPVSVAKCLREIRAITVRDCPNMKAVIVDEEGRDEEIDDIIEFPLLEQLSISRCSTEKFFSYPYRKKEPVATTSDSQDACSDSFFDQKVSLPSLKALYFHEVGSLKRIWHGELPRSSLCKLVTLSLGYCSNLLNIFPSTIIGRLLNLKSINVENYPSLESLFDCGSFDANTKHTTILLPELELLTIKEVGKLRCMVKGDSQMILGFPSLKVVDVENCSDMKYLFPNFTATTLEKLEKIDIQQCKQMKEVVLEEEGCRSKAAMTSFPSLAQLRILQCPNFGTFIQSPRSVKKLPMMSFPSLTQLSILQCSNFGAFIQSPITVKRQLGERVEEYDESLQLFNEMVTFPNITSLKIEGLQCKELWNNKIPTDSFQKLESLRLKDCDNLQHVAPCCMWKRLRHCLINLEGIKLRSLVLHDLENLRCIWQFDGLPNVLLPNLRYVEAVKCSRLKMLFPTSTAKFLGQIEELVVESCENMELIASHEQMEEATGTTIALSKLTTLRLFKLPKFRSFLPEEYSLKFPW